MRRLIRAGIILASIIAAGAAMAGDQCRYSTYRATVTKVIDGDTIRADVELGFQLQVNREIFRLHGIDAPETQSRGGRRVSEAEKVRGLAAKAALKDLIDARPITICVVNGKRGKYGRYIARIFVGDLDVNEWLIDQGHAIPYGERSAALN